MSENVKILKVATIGDWHSWHPEVIDGETIPVTDGYSAGWDGPIYLRPDGTWGHDLRTNLGRMMEEFDREQEALRCQQS